MDAVLVLRFILANSATMTAMVPASKIIAGIVPINTPMPAIELSHISTQERKTVAMTDADVLTTSRVQITAMSKSYAEIKAILRQIRKSLINLNGLINGVQVDSILSDSIGPDFKDEEAQIYMQSRDFIVKLVEQPR